MNGYVSSCALVVNGYVSSFALVMNGYVSSCAVVTPSSDNISSSCPEMRIGHYVSSYESERAKTIEGIELVARNMSSPTIIATTLTQNGLGLSGSGI